jgi:hypothetical protein
MSNPRASKTYIPSLMHHYILIQLIRRYIDCFIAWLFLVHA